jgi:hypothetical protein
LFSFLKGSAGVQDSPKLQAHAEQVFGLVIKLNPISIN